MSKKGLIEDGNRYFLGLNLSQALGRGRRHSTECPICGGGTGQAKPCNCAARLVALRELRLYHWNTALYYRAQDLNESANFHIGFVQLLNEFFSVGDTAEQDAEIRNRKSQPMYSLEEDNED